MNKNKLPTPLIAIGWTLMVGVVLILVVGCNTPTKTREPLSTVGHVDLKRYAGEWHEVARLPNWFQDDKCKASAEYTALPDGKIQVVNRQWYPDGSQKEIKGNATPVEGSHNARLIVKFKGWASLAPAPAEGNYWILQLSEDYSVSLVGTPDRKCLWLLARDPGLDEKVIDRYLQQARLLGFDTSKVIRAGR